MSKTNKTNKKVYVRLKPLDPRRGYVCRRYVWQSTLFRTGEWKLIPRAAAEVLAKFIQPNSAESPKALFDIAEDAAAAQEIRRKDNPEPETEVAGAIELPDTRFAALTGENAPKEDPAAPAPEAPSLDELFADPDADGDAESDQDAADASAEETVQPARRARRRRKSS